MEVNRIYNENCQTGLKKLPDNSIDCCITSPPYYGLRDYGHTKQIGLEETPELYVQKMVEVFSEVKRVLKKEGTLFLNLGDSYFGSGKGGNPEGSKWKGFVGNKDREKAAMPVSDSRHATSYDTSDKAPEDCLTNDYFSESLCGVCQLDYQNRKSHKDGLLVPKPAALLFSQIRVYMEAKRDHLPTSDFFHLTQILQSFFSIQDLAHISSLDPSRLASFLPTMFAEFYRQYQDSCLLTSKNVSNLLSFETLLDYVQGFADMLLPEFVKTFHCNRNTVLPFSEQVQNSQYTFGYCSRCGVFSPCLTRYEKLATSRNILKPKDLIGIPWMLAFALRADGWYLRQDIIWAKPNPMPESVTDRCTKSHEYVFLLSKSSKYYYDAEAIRQEMADSSIERLSQNIEMQFGSDRVPNKTNGNMKAVGRKHTNKKYTSNNQFQIDKDKVTHSGLVEFYETGFANKRSVWTVTTKPYSDAHFATFPEDLVVDMIKAGCPENGIVLDPFMGAGTTALVASKLNRNYIGFELNEQYVSIANKRLHKHLGMFHPSNVPA